jgi:hypothetical protein
MMCVLCVRDMRSAFHCVNLVGKGKNGYGRCYVLDIGQGYVYYWVLTGS